MKERYYDPGVAEFIRMTCQLYGTKGLDPEDCIQEGWAAYLTFRQRQIPTGGKNASPGRAVSVWSRMPWLNYDGPKPGSGR